MLPKRERTYTLRIAGKDYTITSADAPEHVRRMGVYVDRRIAETASSSFVSRESAAIIAALSIADELISAQDDNTRLRRELLEARQALKQQKQEENHADESTA
ncbi:MAG: cell division protein ZapA [Clostridia bacterium]|nr:cell division protein ZapA [Clostridia bacterium]MBR0406995.1 cell division protein ZapA [Clostridia bacterium]